MPTLRGERIVVTGAGRGLGAAVALHLHALRADLLLVDRNGPAFSGVRDRCPGATTLKLDLSEGTPAVDRLAGQLPDRVDTLIHFGGGTPAEADVTRGLAEAVWPRMVDKGGVLVFGGPTDGGVIALSARLAAEGVSYDIMSVVVRDDGSAVADPGAHARAFSYLAIRPMHLTGTVVTTRELIEEQAALAVKSGDVGHG